MNRLRLTAASAALCISLLSAVPVAAAPGGNGGNNNGNNDNGNNPPSVAATPELGSLALFGTGAAGMAGYVLMRIRARRRQDDWD
jgi:hypothetical protein